MSIHDLELIHYSEQPLEKIFSREQMNVPRDKPQGLWVSVDNENLGWKDFCDGNNFNKHRFAHKNKIILSPNANILHIGYIANVLDFSDEYNAYPRYHDRRLKYDSMDWLKVSKKYQGIIISPYCWNSRADSHAFWYYSWDCASGCIWDKEAIEKIEIIND